LGGGEVLHRELLLCLGLEAEVAGGLPPSGMACNLGVMAKGYNAPMQIKGIWHIGLPH
jgi:hypothetical protein